jgi:hypothetical protein
MRDLCSSLILASPRVAHPQASSPSFKGALRQSSPKSSQARLTSLRFLLAAALLTANPQQGDLEPFN